jgi:hypothetical protein
MSNKPIKNMPGMIPPPGYKLNVLSNNWIFCPDPKIINPITGRCSGKISYVVRASEPSSVKAKSPTRSVTIVAEDLIAPASVQGSSVGILGPIKNRPGMKAPEGYKLNTKSNNWIHCPDPKVINPLTGRCVTIGSSRVSQKAKSPVRSVTVVADDWIHTALAKPATIEPIPVPSSSKANTDSIKNIPGVQAPPGYKLNILSNNWIYCPDPRIINPITGRCVKQDSRTLPRSPSKQASEKGSDKASERGKSKVTQWMESLQTPLIKPKTIVARVLEKYMEELSKSKKLTRRHSTSNKSKKSKNSKRRGSL